MQGNQFVNRAPAARRLDVCVGVAPEENPRLHQFAKLKTGHPRIGLIGDDLVEMLVVGDFLAAARQAAVDAEGHRGDRFRQHPNAGQHGRALEGRLWADGDARGRPAGVPDLLEDAGEAAAQLDQLNGGFVGRVGHQNTMS